MAYCSYHYTCQGSFSGKRPISIAERGVSGSQAATQGLRRLSESKGISLTTLGLKWSRSVKSDTTSTSSVISTTSDESSKSIINPHGNKLEVSPGFLLGVPLALAVERTNPAGSVPKIITTCVDFLNRHGLDTEGLFRVPGSGRAVTQYLMDFEAAAVAEAATDSLPLKRRGSCRGRMVGPGPVFEDTDGQPIAAVHDVAGVLVKYLRMIPQGLLTSPLSPIFARIATAVISRSKGKRKLIMKSGQISALQSLLWLLPVANRESLRLLIALGDNISSNSHANAMTSANIAICIGHTIAGDEPRLVQVLIDNYKDIFPDSLALANGKKDAERRTTKMNTEERSWVVAALATLSAGHRGQEKPAGPKKVAAAKQPKQDGLARSHTIKRPHRSLVSVFDSRNMSTSALV